jgi:hypothetical protein
MRTKRKIIHNRKIDITTYESGPDSVIVEGVLHDQRMVETYRPAGDSRPPGTVHHMLIRMEIKGPRLVIQDIEVEMPTIPHEDCIETVECLHQLKGVPIVSGFTAQLKKLAGGRKGCCHLVSLMTAMAPAAVQGAWSAVIQQPVEQAVYKDMALKRVKNTCWVWREDGPLISTYKAKE